MSRSLVILVLLFSIAVPAAAQTAEDLFQQAIRVERLSGNTEAAIALYQQIVDEHSSNRSVTASALLQLGKAYELLGREEASVAYNRILSEYSDFDDVARAARTGIARTSESVRNTEHAPFSTTLINLYDDLEGYGSALSPSGRFFASTSVHGDQSIVQVDLITGERITLVQGAPQIMEDGTEQSGFGGFVRYSPDETELAYRWRESGGNGLIKIVNLESGMSRTVFNIRDYFSGRIDYDIGFTYPYVVDWTRDGSSLLVSASAWSVDREGLSNKYDMHMFMLPLNGSEPRIIAQTEELEYWMQSPACLAGDDRYVMMDYNDGKTRWIQRIDVRSGESVAWRKAEGATYSLAGCPADEDQVLYSSKHLSIPYIWAGDAKKAGSSDSDDMVYSNGTDLLAWHSSDKADLLVQPSGPSIKYVAIDANPQTASLLETQTDLEEGWSSSGAWDPTGERLAWGGLKKLNIWDRSTRQSTSFEYDVVAERGEVHWFPNGTEIGLWRTDGTWFSSFDLETGEQSVPIEFEGVKIKAIGADGKSLIVVDRNSPKECFERLDLASSKRRSLFCLEGESYEGSALVEYHDYSKYLFSGWNDDGTSTEIGIVDAEGNNPRVVYERLKGDGSQRYFTWSSPTHIAMGELSAGPVPYRRKIINSIAQLDTETGELTPMYESIFSYMGVFYFQVSPDGETAVFYALPPAKSGSRSLSIIHNVLGAKGDN